MRLLVLALAIVFVHLWTGALSGEGASKAHRLARISAITGLVVVLAFVLVMVWASLSFPPGIFGILYVAIASIALVATTVSSLGLSIALHLRARREQA